MTSAMFFMNSFFVDYLIITSVLVINVVIHGPTVDIRSTVVHSNDRPTCQVLTFQSQSHAAKLRIYKLL